MSNPFKNAVMRKEYDAAKFAFDAKHANLFINGQCRSHVDQNIGSTFADYFWAGFDGFTQGRFDMTRSGSEGMVAYAYYRAGQDAARHLASEMKVENV